jgi:hypothetical protein
MSAGKSIVPFGNWFDRVRVRTTSVTEAAGLAGRTGQVYGETRPSSSGVARNEIIGELTEDYAVNVHFDDLNKSIWLTRGLLEFVDHAPGTQITAGGITRVRAATGEWIETSAKAAPQQLVDPQRDNRRVKTIVWIVIAMFLIILLTGIIKWL